MCMSFRKNDRSSAFFHGMLETSMIIAVVTLERLSDVYSCVLHYPRSVSRSRLNFDRWRPCRFDNLQFNKAVTVEK